MSLACNGTNRLKVYRYHNRSMTWYLGTQLPANLASDGQIVAVLVDRFEMLNVKDRDSNTEIPLISMGNKCELVY